MSGYDCYVSKEADAHYAALHARRVRLYWITTIALVLFELLCIVAAIRYSENLRTMRHATVCETSEYSLTE